MANKELRKKRGKDNGNNQKPADDVSKDDDSDDILDDLYEKEFKSQSSYDDGLIKGL